MSIPRLTLLTALALLAATLLFSRAQAQTVPDFTLKTAANADVALRSYTGKKAVVVVFLNPACAFSRLYQDRLAALNNRYGGQGVQFLFINVPINLEGVGAAAPGSVDLPTLSDPAAEASAALGVTKTAEAVVLQPEGNGFAVRYRGAIDDNPQVAGNVQQKYVQQVLDNLLAGRAAGVEGKRAAGCLIKR